MRRIAFINEKGGTCKTTLCVNLAASLALHQEQRVLVIDLDTQGHAGKSLGIDTRTATPTTHDLLLRPEVQVADVARPTAVPRLEVVPSNKALGEFPVEVASDPDRALRLDRKTRALGGYDFVFFDAPPSTGLVTTNILAAADEVVIPVSATYFALDGCAEIVGSLEALSQKLGRPAARISLVVPTLVRQTALASEILEKLAAYFPEQLSKAQLGFNVKIDEAQSHGLTIFEYAPASSGAKVMRALADELWARAAPAQVMLPP